MESSQEKHNPSFREQRIRKITHLYYSRKDIQNAIFTFSKNREISPRYFEGFGKRPDSLQYPNDVFEMAKKGATSFHCSEELWNEPLDIITGMKEEQLNELRIGWDLLIDIDCKYFDYSKLAAKSIINVLRAHNIKNIGLKFSGNKGWHILIPWKAFPKEIAGEPTKNLFPDLPKKIVSYIRFKSHAFLKDSLPEDFYNQFKNVNIKKGVKCKNCKEIADKYELTDFFCNSCGLGEQRKIIIGEKQSFKCPNCTREFDKKKITFFYECNKCNLDSKKDPNNFSVEIIDIDLFELMGLDMVLVSPRHLFRTPYSLHEKTSLVSAVINMDELETFDLKNADPMKVKIKNFNPDPEEGEAKELVTQALDWSATNKNDEVRKKSTGKFADFKPIQLTNLSETNFPPCVQKILKGVDDGKKRATFVLINLFRSVGIDKDQLEKKIYDWNKKNNPPLKEGYIKSQLSWAYRKKPVMPPNCKEFYQGIAVCIPDDFCKLIKNPVNYTIRKNLQANKKHVDNKKSADTINKFKR